MTADFLGLLAAYFLCSAEAETRVLSKYEAQQCLSHLTAIKIELVEDVSQGDYLEMTLTERAKFEAIGYRAYLDWKQDNADIVSRLQSKARLTAGSESS